MHTLREFFARIHGVARICCVVLGVSVTLLPFFISGLQELSYAYSAFALLFYLCALCDIQARRIPNEFLGAGLVVWACGVVGIVYTAFIQAQLPAMLFLIAIFIFDAIVLGLMLIGISYLLRGRRFTSTSSKNNAYQVVGSPSQGVSVSTSGIGAGDIKLMCLLALITPPLPLAATLVVACITSIIYAVIRKTRTFPWAPFIVGSWYLCVLTPFYSSVTDTIATLGIF